MSDELRKNLQRMLKEQTEKQLRSHQELAFIRNDYYRLPNESRMKLKDDMLALKGIIERLQHVHMRIESKDVFYEIAGFDEKGNEIGMLSLGLSPELWLEAIRLWDETENA
jgi:hypothetical protein